MGKDRMAKLEVLFNSYFSHLVLYAVKFVKDSKVAEDIVQDVFLHLLETNRIERATASYLFTCTRNAALNYFHSTQGKQQPLSPMQEQLAEEDIAEAIAYMEKLNRLDKVIASLPEKCRQVFTEVYLHQRRYEEVAAQLNISYHTVKAHMNMAYKLIRKHFLILLLSIWKKKKLFH